MRKLTNTKATTKKATVTNKAKAGKQAATVKPVAKAVASAAPATVAAPKALSDTKQALNKAFLAALPTARPIFQAKYKPLNLEAHNPTHASERDSAFIKALRSVYGSKPFTQADSGADSGNLARAIKLNLVLAGKLIDGVQSYTLAA